MTRSVVELGDAVQLQRWIQNLAEQIRVGHPDLSVVTLVGIRTRGVPLAHRLAQRLWQQSSPPDSIPIVGALDITFFRDDLERSGLRTPDRTEMPQDVTDRQVILVDDVIFRGRTVRAALEALHHFGRPQVVRLAVLIDRGHREFPIQPDYVGQVIATEIDDGVRVHLQEQDGEDRVLLERARGEDDRFNNNRMGS